MENIYWILDNENNPIPSDLEGWSKWMINKNRIIKQDQIGNFFISTIFLGLMSFPGNPMFETMVFDESLEENSSLEQERNYTKKEALNFHEEMIKKYKCINESI